MAVTRIKTNQITDLAVTTGKIADNAITAGKLADSITYGSNLTISGNLTVSGTTTTVNSTNTTVADPLMVLSSGATGSGAVDSGMVTERGDDTNVFIGWDESADQFVVATTSETGSTAGNITIAGYSALQAGSLIVDNTTLDADGITTSSGDFTINPNGNLALASNRITGVADPSADQDVATKAYVDSVSASSTRLVEGNTTVTVDDSGTGSVAMEIDSTSVFTATSSEVTLASAKISDLTDNRVLIAGAAGVVEDDANLHFDGTTFAVGDGSEFAVVAASGNTTVGGTFDVTGQVNLNATTASSSKTTGALIVDGGVGVAEDIYTGGQIVTEGALDVGGNFTASAAGAVVVGSTFDVTGASNFNATTTSTSTTTGAVIIDGGLGLAENLHMGGSLEVSTNLTVAGSSTLNGAVTLGDASADAITVNGTIGSDLLLEQSGGSKPDIQLKNTNADAEGGRVHFVKDSASAADGDKLGSIAWTGDDDGGNATQFAELMGTSVAIADGSEDGALVLNAAVGGTATDILTVGATAAGALQIRAHSSYSPSDNLDLATKAYADNAVSAAGDTISKLDSSVVVTDTGSDGKITFTTDNTEVGSFDGSTFTAGGMTFNGGAIARGGSDITMSENFIVTGNLTVNGTTSTTNSTTVTVDDPIFTLGGDSAPGSDDGKDRGIEFRYYDGSAKLGFFGYDNSADSFVYLTDVTNSSEVMSGTAGNITVGSVTSGALTDGRVVTAGTSGILEDNAGFTWDGTNVTTTGEYIGATLNISGAGDVGGDFSVATNKLTVAASSGNTVVAGTLNSTGVITASATDGSTSNTSGSLVVAGGLGLAENLHMGGLLDVDGAATVGGQLTVTGSTAINGAITVASSQTISMGANKVTNVAEPVASTDAATKAYVDAQSGAVTRLVENNSTATISDTGSNGAFTVELDSTTALTATSAGVTVNSATVSDLTNNRITIAGTGGALEDDANLTFDGTTFSVSSSFTVAHATGNTAVGGTLDVTGKVTATGALEVDGTATLADAVIEDLTSGRVVTAGTSGALEDSANLTFDGTTLTTTAAAVDNVSIDGNTISSTSGKLIIEGVAGQEIVVNEASADVDVRIESDNDANAFFIQGSTGNVGLGTASPTTDATLHISATDSMIIPVGTTGQRPASPATGMYRFNTTLGTQEIYTGSEWNAGADFTVMTADSFSGDDTTTAFTLSSSGTTSTTLVAINGVVQIPTDAYAVSGTTLTFTEAPATGDTVDARVLTTTSTITAMQDADADTSINVEPTADADEIQFTVAGTSIAKFTSAGLIPNVNSNGTTGHDLGASNAQWKDLYVSSGSLYVNGKQVLQDDSGTITMGTDANQNLSVNGGSGSGKLQLSAGSGIELNRATTMGSGVSISAHADDSATGVLLPSGSKSGNVTVVGNSVKNDVTNENLVLASNGSGIIQLNDDATCTGNMIVSGNLTVNGSTTTVSSTNTTVEDPLQIWATGQSGTPAYDSGWVVERGSSANVGMIWDESADQFAAINTSEDGTTAGNVTISSYANMRVDTLTGTATAAQYADLAECYAADAEYAPGTVVHFGGSHEVSICDIDGCKKVAGVVTSNPAYLMNAEMEAEHKCSVALVGRVPVKVTGSVKKGDMMVSDGNGGARAEEDPKMGQVIGKALEDHEGEGTIEVVVGRM